VLDAVTPIVAKLGKWDPMTGEAKDDYAQITDDARDVWRRLYRITND
jgi:hypothetical protein